MPEPALEREMIGLDAAEGRLAGGRSALPAIRTVKDFEAAVAASRAGAPILRGTTGTRFVDYSSVLEDGRLTALSSPGGKAVLYQDLAAGLNLLPDETTQMPMVTTAVTGVVVAQLAKLQLDCAKGLVGACKSEVGLQGVLTDLNAAETRSPGCAAAAKAYANYYPDLEAPADTAAAFDKTCLASAEPRKAALGYTKDLLPPELAGFHRPAAGEFTPIAVLEVDGVPFCGGLLRNDRTLVTAAHCFTDAEAAWNADRVKVRPVDGRGGPWAIDKTPAKAGAGIAKTQGDWAVYKLLTADPIQAAAPALAPAATPGPAWVLAYFKDHGHAAYGPTHSIDNWKRGLRWPRAGLCAIESALPDCVRLLCQTTTGFSGAPVFAKAANGEIAVVGFISRAAVADGGACGARTPFVTVAVASTLPGS